MQGKNIRLDLSHMQGRPLGPKGPSPLSKTKALKGAEVLSDKEAINSINMVDNERSSSIFEDPTTLFEVHKHHSKKPAVQKKDMGTRAPSATALDAKKSNLGVDFDE